AGPPDPSAFLDLAVALAFLNFSHYLVRRAGGGDAAGSASRDLSATLWSYLPSLTAGGKPAGGGAGLESLLGALGGLRRSDLAGVLQLLSALGERSGGQQKESGAGKGGGGSK
ncbi:MAG: hypothetical protein IRY95_04685, partial [Clostridia bacterium]|nr:hypothetical protein [Clostridia bacterium]